MIAETVERRGWSRRFRWGFVFLIFTVQLGLIFWLSDSRTIPLRTLVPAPVLRLAGPGSAQLLALVDPTLFARPHRQGFSGLAWMAVPPQEFRPFMWAEAPAWLILPVNEGGMSFPQFVTTNSLDSQQPLAQSERELNLPLLPPIKVFPQHSTLEVAGELARRSLLSKPDLLSWTNVEILTNSVVQTVVDADGRPISVTLLPPGSGYAQADQQALTLARSARFNAVSRGETSNPLAGLTWGEMIFVWHTLPTVRTDGKPVVK